MSGDEQETVTRQDLTEFRTFLLEQLKSHTSELSSKFEKASTDAESALSASKQFKVESELKFSYPERNRKIRIADFSEGGWLTVKHYESNAVALDLEDDKRIRAAEREALRVKTRTRPKRQNAERVQGRYPPFSQPYALRRHFQSSQFASSTAAIYQQPRDSYNRQRGACRFCGSSGHWRRECPVRLARTFTTGNAVHAAGASPSTSTTRYFPLAVLGQPVFYRFRFIVHRSRVCFHRLST
ncbi:uncharacterized protein [Montipora capricornis]|uniref:uncharacterized protein n=1 Tax=Montipora capricornis TaxID=246305 RepID=UPI0035F11B46